ncbi:MAG: M15 family metallopeptidase [Microcoleaceae cyanobacterium]
MKPYQSIIIKDCGEPLVPIPLEQFAVESPHPYQKLGAPYDRAGVDSPYYLRQGVLHRLIQAQAELNTNYPNFKIQIFDAYRPVEVQQFMVDYVFQQTVKSQGLNPEQLSPDKQQEILEQVYQFWAIPSLNSATPPPHSTGAAIDVTLVDEAGKVIDMGSPIDELSPRSYPAHFASSTHNLEQTYDQNRQILSQVMKQAGFQQHPGEWWHFSYGDQLWVWLSDKPENTNKNIAQYGRYA